MRLSLPAVLMPIAALLAGSVLTPAVAQQSAMSQQVDDIRNLFGFGKDRPPIDFTERPPLVVPPTNNLPPPLETAVRPPIVDPDAESRSKALSDPRRPVPPTDPGASLTGASSRTYLIDPPAGLRDPNAVASDVTTDTSATTPGKVPHHHHARKKAAVQASQ